MNVIVDTHSHLYPCFDIPVFIENTWKNMEDISPGSIKAIILTERSQENYFKRICSSKILGHLHILPTKEEKSFYIRIGDNKKLFIISGQQLLCTEGIEILVLGPCGTINEKMPLHDMLKSIAAHGAFAVIPWSFGKWMFERKKIIADLLKDSSLIFSLGDIWGRACIFGGKDIFTLGQKYNRKILFGTDPLPLVGEEKHSGKLSTLLAGEFDESFPWRSIEKLLHERPLSCGTHAPVSKAMYRQISLRF